MSGIAIQAVCRFCSKPRNPNEFIAGTVIGMCFHCYEWHQHALGVLSNEPPPGCQECGITFGELYERADREFKMRLYRKDGIYQILCEPCGDRYERKRLDQFGNTPYGQMRGLDKPA